MELTGRWKTRFAWGVIAIAGLIYLASLLPVVAAMEEEVAVVSDQLPSSASDPFSVIMDGTGEPQADTATGYMGLSRPEDHIDSDLLSAYAAPISSSGDEEAGAPQPAGEADTAYDPGDGAPTDPGNPAPIEPEDPTPEWEDPAPSEPGKTAPGADDPVPADSAESDPDNTDPTTELDPAEEPMEPVEPTPEELLAGFIATRLGLVPVGTASFPSHDVNATGEFVFRTSAILGSRFVAAKGREIPTGYSALISYGNGTMDGFELYKNMNHDPYFGDCYITMSADGTVSFNNLAMEVTELYASPLIGVRIFPILELWTTNPGEDLPLGEEESPLDLDFPFYGGDFKVTVIKMTADYIEIPNFSLRVGEGTTQFES